MMSYFPDTILSIYSNQTYRMINTGKLQVEIEILLLKAKVGDY